MAQQAQKKRPGLKGKGKKKMNPGMTRIVCIRFQTSWLVYANVDFSLVFVFGIGALSTNIMGH